jgi:hypothetical protein
VLAVLGATLPLLAAPASAGPNATWSTTRIHDGRTVLGGNERGALAVGLWWPRTDDDGTERWYLRLVRSVDDGATFADPIEAPVAATGTVVIGGLAVDDEGDRTYVVTSLPDPAGIQHVRVDRFSAAGGWSAPLVLEGPECYSARPRTLVATRGSTVVVVDPCANRFRSTDGGVTFTLAAAAPGSYVGVMPQALTRTAAGFSLLSKEGYYENRLVATASVDDGATYSAPTELRMAGYNDRAVQTTVARDASSGVLMAATGVLTDRGWPDSARLRVELRTSEDGGSTWSAPVVRHEGRANQTGFSGAPPLLAWTPQGLDLTAMTFGTDGLVEWLRWRSPDGGQTWNPMTPPPALSYPYDIRLIEASVLGGSRVHLLRMGFYNRTIGNPAAPTVLSVTQTASTVTLQLQGDQDTTGYVVRWRPDGQLPTAYDGTAVVSDDRSRPVTLTGLPDRTVAISVFARSGSQDGDSTPTSFRLDGSTTTLTGSLAPTAVTRPGAPRGYRLVASGPATTGVAVELWGKVRGTTVWSRLRSVPSGTTVSIAPSASMDLQARTPGTSALRYSTSAFQVAHVSTVLRTSLSATTTRLGRAVTLRTTVGPAHPGKTVLLQRYVSGGWRTVASKALSSTSAAAFTVAAPARGRFSYRTALSGHTDHALGVSPAVVLTVG